MKINANIATAAITLNSTAKETVLLNMPTKLVPIPVPNCRDATIKPEASTA